MLMDMFDQPLLYGVEFQYKVEQTIETKKRNFLEKIFVKPLPPPGVLAPQRCRELTHFENNNANPKLSIYPQSINEPRTTTACLHLYDGFAFTQRKTFNKCMSHYALYLYATNATVPRYKEPLHYASFMTCH